MQTLDDLNRRFGAPGRIVFKPGHAGYPEAVLSNRFGVAEVALLGANTLSYRPTGHSPVVFRPARRDYNRGESFHGGIPVCWPQFGNRAIPGMPQHGFARMMPFAVRAANYSEEMTELKLGLESSPETLELWPHRFDLEVTVTVSMKLTLRVSVRNTDDRAFAYSAGLHPYFNVADRDRSRVLGLDGCECIDADSGAEFTQTGDLAMTGPKDHVFTLPPALKHELALLDEAAGRAIAVVANGAGKVVVWNPGQAGKIADFGPDDWRKFVCVEPVTAWPTAETVLEPGEKRDLLVAIQSALDGVEEVNR